MLRLCRPIAVTLVPLLVGGCVDDDAPLGGPLPYWAEAPVGFFDAPWPSDRFRDDDGTIDLSRFPDPSTVDLIEVYLDRAEALDGYGTSSPIYVPFHDVVPVERLPSPAGSRAEGATVFLMDIDPDSPEWGHRVPIRAQVLEGETEWYPANVLAVTPVPGFSLRPATTHALVVTTDIATRHAAFAETLDDPAHPLHDPALAHALRSHGVALDRVAVATVFTTYDPVDEMARIADFLQHDIAPPDLARFPLERLSSYDDYTAWRTHYPSPVFTHGERPYSAAGGQFEFDDAGRPVVAYYDDMRAAVCTPADLSDPPPGGWPVVIYQHGTGGDYRTHCNSGSVFEAAGRLGAEGMVSIGLDQPLHGTRTGGGAVNDLTHFNFTNPDSGLTNFRQGAADAIYLARALADRPWVLRTDDGQEVPLDPDRVMFLGHSQGGLTGAMAAPFWGHDVKATVLSGAGAVLSITLVERKDIVDFQALIESLLGFEDDEVLTEFHPAMALIQTLVEVTDTVNYAPYWSTRRGPWRAHAPAPVLLTNGTDDANTPYRTANALAVAGGLPVIGEAATGLEGHALLGLAPYALPATATQRSFDGRWITGGFAQYWKGSHFVIFEEEHAAQLYVNYLRSTADDAPMFVVEEGVPQR